jgi:predicted dehydrogenase
MLMLKIGILAASGIAPTAVIRPAARRSDVVIAAVAARDASRAAAYAKVHGIRRSYGDYGSLLADPGIDLVYVALPPSGHAEWSIAALEAGKDVLCEKPFAMNATEARRMRQAADDTGHRLIEAFHDRYHPLSAELDELKASGRLGDIVSLDANFSVTIPYDPLSIRHEPAVGGGALMDLGCYAVHWIRAFMNEEPTITGAAATLNPLGADMSMAATMTFESGATATLATTMEPAAGTICSLEVVGTRGTAHVHGLVGPTHGHWIRETIDGIPSERTVRGFETYDHQLSAVVEGLASGTPMLTEGRDSVANMEVIDAIYGAAGFNRHF